MREVRVELPTNGYDILIGEGLEAEIASFFESGGFSSRALILSDTNVGKLYTEKIAELLKHAGKQPSILGSIIGETLCEDNNITRFKDAGYIYLSCLS